jgi:hypothetical protein
MSAWFEIDKDGLAAILERRGKAFALAELVSNAWDSGTDAVSITMIPKQGVPLVDVEVEDWGEGFDDLAHAYTMFAKSRRAGDAEKRGRFCLGEKLVLACCRRAWITSTGGSVDFEDGERKRGRLCRQHGTMFKAEMRMTRAEYEDAVAFIRRMIPPVATELNGEEIPRPDSLCRFTTRLPTEVADADGNLRRTMRQCEVEVYDGPDGGEILEMGVPVVECDMPYRVNVLQKIPLNMDRDNVTPSFLKALQAEVLNHLHTDLARTEQAAEAWVAEAAADPRASTEAVGEVVRQRFGDRAVVAVPGDPLANATAEANGYTVIHGGAMSSGMWANVRKAGTLLPSSKVFPTPTAAQRSQSAVGAAACPLCGRG